jgi:flavin reductase (DIM6/NTAB) family NADH-FMN oxidoreductase RutF
MTPIGPEEFKRGMRAHAAGVTIITTTDAGLHGGLTATAVCSLTIEPPQLLVCVNRRAHAHDLIRRSRVLCINVLAHDQQALAARFAGQDGVDGEARFGIGQWTTLKTGAPVLGGSLVCFDCEVIDELPTTTHTVFIGQVVAMSAPLPGPPLLYADGTYADIAPRPLSDRRRR